MCSGHSKPLSVLVQVPYGVQFHEVTVQDVGEEGWYEVRRDGEESVTSFHPLPHNHEVPERSRL